MGWRGEGTETEGEGGRERESEEVGGEKEEFFFKDMVSVRGEERNEGVPSQIYDGGVACASEGEPLCIIYSSGSQGEKNNKAKESLAYIHYSHPKHSSSPHKDLKLPQTVPVALFHSASWQVGSNPATDPAQVPDWDCFWVKGRTRWLLAPPNLHQAGL